MKQPLAYLDFDLTIEPGAGREYPVRLVSPAGEARETFRLPFDDLQLENALLKLRNALLASGGRRRKVLSPEQEAVRDFGGALFEALICGEVRSRFDVSRLQAEGEGKGLRVRLLISPPEMAALPWELLYDSRQAEYLCLSRNTPIVRYLELPQPPRPLAVTPPLRILGMIAAPHDLIPLDVAREKERIERATRELQSHDLVELTWIEGQTWRDLQQAIWGGPWHIFHFVGHGGFDPNADEGFILLADEESRSHRLSATQLGRLLADHSSLRLVLFNSCGGARGGERDIFSSTSAILVRRGVPGVVAMQYEITDQAAIEFAQAFYGALMYGKPVDEAIVEARKAISLAVSNTVEWGTPVLYTRAPDGQIFDLAGETRPAVWTPGKPERQKDLIPPLLKGPRLRRVLFWGIVFTIVLCLLFLWGWLNNPLGVRDNNNLYVRGETELPGVYLIGGKNANALNDGDQLVVYDTLTEDGHEEPVALLSVVASGNNPTRAQVTLNHPKIEIQAGQKVDKSLDSLGASQLNPAYPLLDGYVLGEGYIVVRGDQGFEEGEVFRACEWQGVYLFLSPIRMRVQEYSKKYSSESYTGSVAARAELLAGKWPEIGTVLINETKPISVTGQVFGFPSGPWQWQGYFTLPGGEGKISGTLLTDYPSPFVTFTIPGGGGYIRASIAPQKYDIFCFELPGVGGALAITFDGVTTEGDWETKCWPTSSSTGFFYRHVPPSTKP